MVKQVIENKNLDKTRKFIEDSFINSKELSINIVNLKKLITFLNKNNIELDYYDLRSLVECSYKLESAIKEIKQRKIINNILENMDFESNKIYTYLINIINENNSKSKKSNEYYKEFNEYQRNSQHNKKLTYEKQKELLIKVSNGDNKAKEELIIAYLPLVIGIASKYKHAWNYEDLVQIGTIGLIEGIENYNYQKGKNFLGFISMYIEGNICRNIYIDIKFRTNNYMRMKLILKLMLENYFKYDKVLSDEEISKITNFKIETIGKLKTIANYLLLDKDNSFNILNLNNELIDNKFEDEILEKEYKNKINELINRIKLTPRENEIIKLIYFDNIENEAEIGRMFGISRERVRQLKTRALRKLRYDLEMRKYTGFNSNFEEDFDDVNKFKKARTRVNQ